MLGERRAVHGPQLVAAIARPRPVARQVAADAEDETTGALAFAHRPLAQGLDEDHQGVLDELLDRGAAQPPARKGSHRGEETPAELALGVAVPGGHARHQIGELGRSAIFDP